MSGGCEPTRKCAAFWIGVGAGMGAAWAAVFGMAYQGADNEDASTASFATAGALGCVAVGSFLASYCVGRDSGCCVRYTP